MSTAAKALSAQAHVSSPPAAGLAIGLVSIRDARDPHTWSGTTYHLAQALEQQKNDVHYISPLRARSLLEEKVVDRIRRRLRLRHRPHDISAQTAQKLARKIQDATDADRPDILFAPAGAGAISALDTDLPIVYTSDATAALMRNYYPRYADRDAKTAAQVDATEARAIARADLLIYPSDWAARSAVQHYGADPARVYTVPYGANMAVPDRATALTPRSGEEGQGPLRLLFIGTDWTRKGGDIAVAALDALVARGIDARLTVIGATPPAAAMRETISVIGFLSKTDPAQQATLAAELLAADFLVLPTQQECFGIVFCEAAAYGVPSIATETGGVPVRDGITGALLPPGAQGVDYADQIEAMLNSAGGLAGARARARNDYEARLNWRSWAETTQTLMQDVVDEG